MTEIKDRIAAASGPEEPSGPPALGLVGWLRWTWRQLTSMKTALVLLFLLALGAVPGSLVPQTAIDPIKVSDFLTAHPKLGPLYDKLGLFDVYKSAWFSAIYLLLFISLIGCVVPRLSVYVKGLRARPPKPPRNLNRLPGYQRFELSEAGDVLEVATRELRKRRFRVQTYDGAVGAERGYLREAGNLLFHFSLILALVGVAWGSLFGYRGSVLVVVGNGFSNSVAQYDDFTPGRAFSGDDDLPPFSLTVKDFEVKFQEDGPQKGAAREFKAQLDYQQTPDAPEQSYELQVNHPLKLDGSSVYLLGHGYAPRVTVRDGQGNVAFSGPAPFLPQDSNFSSFGVVKAPDARPMTLGFEGLLPADLVHRSERACVGVPRRPEPGAGDDRVLRPAAAGDREAGVGVPAGQVEADAVPAERRQVAVPARAGAERPAAGQGRVDHVRRLQPVGEAADQPHSGDRARAGGHLAGDPRPDGFVVHPSAPYLGAGPRRGRAYRCRGRRSGPRP